MTHPTSGANEDLLKEAKEWLERQKRAFPSDKYPLIRCLADALKASEEELQKLREDKTRLIAAAHKIFLHQSWSAPVWTVAADQADELWRAIRDIPPKTFVDVDGTNLSFSESKRDNVSMKKCSACGGHLRWVEDSWYCRKCGAEWPENLSDFERLLEEAEQEARYAESLNWQGPSASTALVIRRLMDEAERLTRELEQRRNDKLMWVKSNLEADEALAQEQQRVQELREALERIEAQAKRAAFGSNPLTKERQLAVVIDEIADEALAQLPPASTNEEQP